MLSDLYSGCHLNYIPDSRFGAWKEPEKEPGWRLKQAALLRAELCEIAAVAGRTVETECCICLDDLEGDGGDGLKPVFVNMKCYHQVHVECAKEGMDPRMTQPTCPTCRT